MSFPASELRPISGELYGHVFENPTVNLPRGLFWSLSMQFAPVEYDGRRWDCSHSVEWLTWPVSSWQDLHGVSLGDVRSSEMVESSFYVAEHHPVQVESLRLHRKGLGFHVDVAARFDLDGYDEPPELDVVFRVEAYVDFTGVIVLPSNLDPEPVTSDQARSVAAEFTDVRLLAPPRWEGFRWVLPPLDGDRGDGHEIGR